MATYQPACHPSKGIGLVDIKIASPFNGVLTQLGHATDMIDTEEQDFLHNVSGDRNGGPQGPPIEIQYLGSIVTVNFTLSSFNQTAVDLVRRRAINATRGTILQSEIGQFLLAGKAFRLLLHTSVAADTRNFWCAIARQPRRVGMGSKYSEWAFSFECHRPPCGHPKADILEDINSDAFA